MNAKDVAQIICAEQEYVGRIRYHRHEEEENTL